MQGRACLSLLFCAAMLLSGCEQPAPPSDGGNDYYSPYQPGAATLSGGSGYRGSNLKKRAGAAPQAATPAAAPAALATTADGRLALPTGYPLMPGDAELWATLTLAQQQRALQFLQSGSTIRSSLRPD